MSRSMHYPIVARAGLTPYSQIKAETEARLLADPVGETARRAAAKKEFYAMQNQSERCPSFDYQEGWDARRANLPYDASWCEAKRNGWNDAQRDDIEENEFYAAGDFDHGDYDR